MVVGRLPGPATPLLHKRTLDSMIRVQRQMKSGKEKGMQMSCSYFREVKLRHSRVNAIILGSNKLALGHISFSTMETEE